MASAAAVLASLAPTPAPMVPLPPPLTSTPASPSSTTATTPGCQLLSTSFGWWLQAILGAVCFVSLVGKRFTDKVRRPWKIWFFDTSKQALSAFVVHFLNILLSMAFGELLSVDADPCNWYWINLTLDDTVGVAIQFLLLRALQCFYRSKCVNKPELALSGEYGDPPDTKIYGRQLLDWQGVIVIQKCILAVFVVRFTVQVTAVAEFLLGWLDPHPRVKLVVVMVATPLTMNVFALWMADNFLQSESTRHEEPQARELLVPGSSPCVVGHRGGVGGGGWRGRAGSSDGGGTPGRRRAGGATPLGAAPASFTDELSGDESDRVLGFEEWKRRAAGRTTTGDADAYAARAGAAA